jgi:hypothetical protein
MASLSKQKKKAIEVLMKQTFILNPNSGGAFPSSVSIAADYMRLYLGEHSHIYQSFKQIDISDKTGDAFYEELSKANELLQAAAQFISDNDVYKDRQLQLWEVQIKDSKRKLLYGVGGVVGGALLSHAEDIANYLLMLFRLPPYQ